MFKKIGEWFEDNKKVIKDVVTGFWEGWCTGAGVLLIVATIISLFMKPKCQE